MSNELRVQIPGGVTIQRTAISPTYIVDAGVRTTGVAQATQGETFLRCYRTDVGAWSASVNTTSLYINMAISVA